MKNYLVNKLFTENQRWVDEIEKAYMKDISQPVLRFLCSPNGRKELYLSIVSGKYQIAPPHTAKIPKDNGDFRTVYINEDVDRVMLSMFNDLLMELCADMIHKNCKSYQKGISCGNIVKDISKKVVAYDTDEPIGFKSDLSKYFDSVPIKYIDEAFDKVEERFGSDALLDAVRKYYHTDIYLNEEMEVCEKYQSLKQGCAVASWLADVIIYHIDEKLTKELDLYVRYSDDMICLGKDYEKAMQILQSELGLMQMTLNPKKVELIDRNHWVKFLGFSIKGSMITLSSNAIKRFQKDIEDATVARKNYVDRKGKAKKYTYIAARNAVYKALYKGYNDYSWAQRVLRVINVDHDIDVLNGFIMDALRAVAIQEKFTNSKGKPLRRCKIGGLGYEKQKATCISRGTGANVKANKERMPQLEDYLTLGCMANAIRTSRDAYDTLVRQMK